jgi:hypothetical protein
MGPGPMEHAASDALAVRDLYGTAGELESVAFIEIDCANAVRWLMRAGSPRLRAALTSLVLEASFAN